MEYVPTTERATWHEKALEAAKGADLHSLVELFLEIKELGRLADLVRRTRDAALEDVSHYATEPAAKKLQNKHPDVAARLWRAQGMRILNAKKSKYYDYALESFERAKRCYQRAGLTAEWAKIVSACARAIIARWVHVRVREPGCRLRTEPRAVLRRTRQGHLGRTAAETPSVKPRRSDHQILTVLGAAT
jgi:hypothetical protein